jgi:hypothetical protein
LVVSAQPGGSIELIPSREIVRSQLNERAVLSVSQLLEGEPAWVTDDVPVREQVVPGGRALGRGRREAGVPNRRGIVLDETTPIALRSGSIR